MHSITIENFRCFRKVERVRLAPLTLLVGENSTGKTSFLALLNALEYLAYVTTPDFKRPPYDLGSFDEIAHHRSGRGGKAKEFSVEVSGLAVRSDRKAEWKLSVEFGREEKGTAPVPHRIALGAVDGEGEDAWIEFDRQSTSIKLRTKRGEWIRDVNPHSVLSFSGPLINTLIDAADPSCKLIGKPGEGSPEVTTQDQQAWQFLRKVVVEDLPRSFSSAPMRSGPERTYNSGHRSSPDPYGYYIPMLLANLSSQQSEAWDQLKKHLEDFGQTTGLFDEIRIRHFGSSNSNPFQVQVKKYGKYKSGMHKGPWRNLIDVGYGVSQALPIIMELLRDAGNHPKKFGHSRPRLFLLQQPEVHLHPSAQAALGSFFCQLVGPQRQLVVETHSDYLMDRVRMDVRDGHYNLRPEDVSILFFEYRDLEVQIHSLRIDREGNIVDAPDGYRKFFMEEMTRSLWPNHSTVEA